MGMSVLRLASFGALLQFAILLQASAAPDTTVPIEVHDGHAYVKVELPHAKPLWFLLDSGAATPVNLIAKDTADRLGWKGAGLRQAPAIGGRVKLTFTPPVALKVGSIELAAEPLAIISLGGSESQEGHAVDGILGYAFFKAFNPEIDYTGQHMRLSESPMLRPGAVALRIAGKTATIGAEIVLSPGQKAMAVTLVVDTGYDGFLLLNSPFVRKQHLLNSPGGTVSGAGVGGDTKRGQRVIASFRIGREIERNFNAALSTDTEGAFSSPEFDGYVGGEFLKHYAVLFDYRHGQFALAREGGAH